MSTPVEWPGYTPPASGSSQNCGTHPLSQYVETEADIRAQYAADGADVSQEPPQYYGDSFTAQDRNEPEAHAAPGTPGTPTVTGTGTAGQARVSWTASQPPPSGGYTVTASSGQTKSVNGETTTADVTGLTSSSSVTFTVTAKGLYASETSAASSAYTVP